MTHGGRGCGRMRCGGYKYKEKTLDPPIKNVKDDKEG